MASDQEGFTGTLKSEPGFHFHEGNAYRNNECRCSLAKPRTTTNTWYFAVFEHPWSGGVVATVFEKGRMTMVVTMFNDGTDQVVDLL